MYSVTGSIANNKWQLTFYLFFLLLTVKENLSNRVDKLEDRLSQVPLFRKEFDKELREILKGHLDDIKKKVINIQQIFLQNLML